MIHTRGIWLRFCVGSPFGATQRLNQGHGRAEAERIEDFRTCDLLLSVTDELVSH